jgi:hypothetical protein
MLTYHTRRRRIAGQGMTEYIIVVACPARFDWSSVEVSLCGLFAGY